MNQKTLAVVFGAISATLNAALVAYVGAADPSLHITVVVLSVAAPINAGLAALAAYLKGANGS